MPATWGKNTLTNQALTMMNQALGISAITFTKAVTITDDITGDSVSQLQALTSVNYKQSRTPKAIATQDNKSRLGVTIDNSDVNEDYIYYGVGLYAKQNSTNQEVLFSVIPLTAGATMIAKENNATTASIYLDLYTDIVRGTQVSIMVSNSGTLSREDVQQMISQSIGNALNYPNETASIGTDFNAILDISITRIINDTTVVNAPSGFSGTGYLTTIGSGDKTAPIMQTLDDTINNIRSTRYFNSTTNVWSEWNAYAKTVDVNQQLDKKVNVSDMRKPASDVAGIDEVNAKQDKLTITPADDSKVVHTADTSSWQKSKITDDAGMPLLMLGDTDDLSTKINGLPNGYFTIYSTAKTLNNPSASPKRGIIHITASRVAGSGILFSEDKNAYIITMLNGTVAYTKIAGDSTVVHNSGDETIGDTKTFTNPIKGTIDGITYRYSAQGDDLNTSYMNDSVIFVGGNQVANAPAGTSGIWAIVRNYNSNATNGAQSYYDTNQGVLYVRTRNDTSTFTPWIQVADDSKVVHTADMRKPASDVVGLEDVPQAVVKSELASGVDLNTIWIPGVYPFNAVSFTNYIDNATYWGYLVVTSGGGIVTQTAYTTGFGQPLYRMQSGSPAAWSPWVRMADDSKVAHLSGANNFDTVPTVNHNPLLLASSLPSDLARTGQAQTFTQPQTFSIAPVINDASKDKGDNQAATMADLKSVEESAWYIIPENNNNTIRDIGWMKRDPVNHYLYILYNFATVPWVPTASEMLVDLSSYVDALDDARGYIMLSSNEWLSVSGEWTLPHSYRAMSTVWAKGATLVVGSGFNFSDPNDGGHYLNLTTFDDNIDNNPWTNKCLRVHYSKWTAS